MLVCLLIAQGKSRLRACPSDPMVWRWREKGGAHYRGSTTIASQRSRAHTHKAVTTFVLFCFFEARGGKLTATLRVLPREVMTVECCTWHLDVRLIKRKKINTNIFSFRTWEKIIQGVKNNTLEAYGHTNTRMHARKLRFCLIWENYKQAIWKDLKGIICKYKYSFVDL